MRQSQVFLRLLEKKKNTHSRDHPRKAGKYVQRMSDQSHMVFPKSIQRKLKEGIPESLVV